MAPPQSSPDLLPHIRVVVSIIVGLCITTLFIVLALFLLYQISFTLRVYSTE
jgi:hypothetical protein